MRYRAGLLTLTVIVFLAFPAVAQKGRCTEEFIRSQLGQQSPWPKTDDYYLFNPLLDKPVVGEEERQKANDAHEPLMAKRKNLKTTFKTERVVVASSGDMAYEYGTQQVSYEDSDSGKHVDTALARLTVWKADGESCKAAAAMLQREGQR